MSIKIVTMDHQRLEARVLDIVQATCAGEHIEDDLAEAKAVWPSDKHRAARRLGGMANQAGGQQILWIIGLDEDRHRVVPVDSDDMAEWWPSVQKHFDQLAPALYWHRRVVVGPDKSVIALAFETADAPYVVKAAKQGVIEREVPWREGTRVRTAHRHELLRSVVQQAVAPAFAPLKGLVRVYQREEGRRDSDAHVEVEMSLFVSSVGSARVTLPQYRQRWTLQGPGFAPFEFTGVAFTGPTRRGYGRPSSLTGAMPREHAGYIDVLDDGTLIIDGSAPLTLRAWTTIDRTTARELPFAPAVNLEAALVSDQGNRSGLHSRFRHDASYHKNEADQPDVPNRPSTMFVLDSPSTDRT